MIITTEQLEGWPCLLQFCSNTLQRAGHRQRQTAEREEEPQPLALGHATTKSLSCRLCQGGEPGEGHHCAVSTGPKGNKLQHRRVRGELRKCKQLQRKRRYEAMSDDTWHVNNLLGFHLYVLSLCASSFQLGPASSTSFSASSPATGHLNSCVGAKE